jgi:hypothetical protein
MGISTPLLAAGALWAGAAGWDCATEIELAIRQRIAAKRFIRTNADLLFKMASNTRDLDGADRFSGSTAPKKRSRRYSVNSKWLLRELKTTSG